MKLTEMLTIRPKRRCVIAGTTAWINSNAEKKCASSQPSHAARLSVRKSAGVWRVPGLVIRMSGPGRPSSAAGSRSDVGRDEAHWRTRGHLDSAGAGGQGRSCARHQRHLYALTRQRQRGRATQPLAAAAYQCGAARQS